MGKYIIRPVWKHTVLKVGNTLMFTRSTGIATLAAAAVLALSATAHATTTPPKAQTYNWSIQNGKFSITNQETFTPSTTTTPGNIWCQTPYVIGLDFFSDAGFDELLRRVNDGNCNAHGRLNVDFDSSEPVGTIVDQFPYARTILRKENAEIDITISLRDVYGLERLLNR